MSEIKYSIILPYYKRPEMRQSFASFIKQYSSRHDFEVIVVEDTKNQADEIAHEELLCILDTVTPTIKIKHIKTKTVSYCPAHKFNEGVNASTGEFIVLSNPETEHTVDVLSGFDAEFGKNHNAYIVCACANSDNGKFIEWYQHSLYANNCFHFCTAISKENYDKVGGFDERYNNGIAYEDCNFIARIRKFNIPIITRDDLLVTHIAHSKEYQQGKDALIEVNKKVYENQLRTNTL